MVRVGMESPVCGLAGVCEGTGDVPGVRDGEDGIQAEVGEGGLRMSSRPDQKGACSTLMARSGDEHGGALS